MSRRTYLGEPSPNVKRWMGGGDGPAEHAETWYKYAGDAEWRTISIVGELALKNPDSGDDFSRVIENSNLITEIEIGTNVSSIGNYSFVNNDFLFNVVIPHGVMSIGHDAFEHCISLSSITIPNSVSSVGEDAFDVCEGLTSLTIPDSVTLGNWAFYGCNLAQVTIVANGGNALDVKNRILETLGPTSSNEIDWIMPT